MHIASGHKLSIEKLVPGVRHARQAPVAAVLGSSGWSAGLPVAGRVAIVPELGHVRNVQEVDLAVVSFPHFSDRLVDERVVQGLRTRPCGVELRVFADVALPSFIPRATTAIQHKS